MSERSALRHLSESKATRMVFEHGYETDGHVLYRHADQSYAVVCHGRVRHLSEAEMRELLCYPKESA